MALFEYRALQPDGAIAQGNLQAEGRPDAFRQIETKGLKLISLVERASAAAAATEAEDKGGWNLQLQSGKISSRMLEDFTRLLSSLLAAGIPLSRAMVILYKEASSPAASRKWKEVHDRVIDGMSLADAMAQSPEVFPRVYVAMVQAGEAGGFLDLVLAQIADFQAREKDLRSKMLTAMLYPAILLFLAIGVLIFLMVFFIPQISIDIFRVWRRVAAVDAGDHWRQPPGAVVRSVCGGRLWPGGVCRSQLVQISCRAAAPGSTWCSNRRWWGRWWPSSPWHAFAACWAPCWGPGFP